MVKLQLIYKFFNLKLKAALILGGLVFVLYFVNIRPAIGSFYIIKGLGENKKIQTGFYNQSEVLKDFRKGFSYGSFGQAENSVAVGDYALSLSNVQSKVFSDDMKAVFDLAIQKMVKTVKANPQDARFRAILGMLYFRFAEYDTGAANLAEKILTEVNLMSPNRPDILLILSKAELAIGNNKKSIANLRQAIALAPKSVDLNINLAMYYFLDGDITNAKDAVEVAKKLQNGHFSTISNINKLLMFYEKYELYSDMPPFYYDAMIIEPKNADWPAGLAEVYSKLGNREKAAEMAEKAIELDPLSQSAK